MSNSTSLLDQISSSQAQKEVTANALFDSASPATIWGRHASATSGLVWAYYGGNYQVGATANAVANGTVTLTASTTNYIYANATTGAVTAGTAGFPAGSIPLYTVVTGSTTITSWTDYRSYQPGAVASGGWSPPSASANTVLAGPASGAAATAAFRALVAADLPLMGASGAGHAAGAVPDPGATSGTTRYLREDATWAVPAGGGGGSGTVTSVGATGGVETDQAAGAAISTSGNIREAMYLAGGAIQTAAYTWVTGDRGKTLVMNSAGAVSQSMPTPTTGVTSNFPTGWFARIENIGAGATTVAPPTGTKLDGVTNGTLVLAQNTGATLFTDGTDYYSVRGSATGGGGSAGLINIRIFTANTTYTPTTGTTAVMAEVLGAGAAGAGAVSVTGGQVSAGGAGGAGGYARHYMTSGFSGVSIVVGAGGTGNTGAAGTAGGASSFGSVTANGGTSGASSSAGSATLAAPGGGGGSASGANLVNSNGWVAYTTIFGAGYTSGGQGANTVFGAGGNYGYEGNGGNATGYGAGGGGTLNDSGGSNAGAATKGGNGAPGVVIVYEYGANTVASGTTSAAPSIVQKASNFATSSPVTVTLGSSPIVGNMLVAVLGGHVSSTLSLTPGYGSVDGWSVAAWTQNSNNGIYILTRPVLAGDGTSWTFTLESNVVATLYEVSGGGLVTGFAAIGKTPSSSTAQSTASGGGLPCSNTLVISGFENDAGAAFASAASSGWTIDSGGSSTGMANHATVCISGKPNSGGLLTPGTITWSGSSTSQPVVSATVAIAPSNLGATGTSTVTSSELRNAVVLSSYYTPLQPFLGSAQWSSTTYGSGNIQFMPIVVHRPMTIQANISVNGAVAASSALVGIYAQDPTTGMPGALLKQFSTLSMAATGIIQSTDTYTIQPGVYWVAHQASAGSINTRGLSNGSTQPPGLQGLLGFSSSVLSSGSGSSGGLNASSTYSGTLPASGGSLTFTNSNGWYNVFFNVTAQS